MAYSSFIAFLRVCLLVALFKRNGQIIRDYDSKTIKQILSFSFNIFNKYLIDFLTSFILIPDIEPLTSITHIRSIGAL